MFFKKNKIKFYCELPEVKEKYHIITAGEYKFKCIRESANNWDCKMSRSHTNNETRIHCSIMV